MADHDIRQLDAICKILYNVLKGIGKFQQEFFPLDASDLGSSLLPLKSSLDKAAKDLKTTAVADALSEFRLIIGDSISLLQNVLESLLKALEMEPHESVERVADAYRQIGDVQEKLYSVRLSSHYIDRIFLEPGIGPLSRTSPKEYKGPQLGLFHYGNEDNNYARGAFSLYVPETYEEATEWPLIVALHGGSGHGRSFIWMWLREARSNGMILLSPTSLEHTWSILEPESDGEALFSILDFVDRHYNIDMNRILITGFSDGGTFALMTALQESTPFSAFAPISCVLPPFDMTFVKDRRIYWTHGALDWMFPVRYAEEGCKALRENHAQVTLRVLENLSHTYPREENRRILEWFDPDLTLLRENE